MMATIKNLTNYPNEEVSELVKLACKGVNTKNVRVIVDYLKDAPKNSNAHGQYFGRGWFAAEQYKQYAKHISDRASKNPIIFVWILDASRFPYTRTYRQSLGATLCRNWRDFLVGIAAHEAYHHKLVKLNKNDLVRNFKSDKIEYKRGKNQEYQCQKFAQKRLVQFQTGEKFNARQSIDIATKEKTIRRIVYNIGRTAQLESNSDPRVTNWSLERRTNLIIRDLELLAKLYAKEKTQ